MTAKIIVRESLMYDLTMLCTRVMSSLVVTP